MTVHQSGSPLKFSEIFDEFNHSIAGRRPPMSIGSYYRRGGRVPDGTPSNANISTLGAQHFSNYYGSIGAPYSAMFPGNTRFEINGNTCRVEYTNPGTFPFTVPYTGLYLNIGVCGGGGGASGGIGNYYNWDPVGPHWGVPGGAGTSAANTYPVQSGVTYNVVVGAGGHPGHYSWARGMWGEGPQANGTAGGTSSFGSLIFGAGGNAGVGYTQAWYYERVGRYTYTRFYSCPTPASPVAQKFTLLNNSFLVRNTWSYGPPAHYNSSMPIQPDTYVPYGTGGHPGDKNSWYAYEPNPGAGGYVTITFDF